MSDNYAVPDNKTKPKPQDRHDRSYRRLFAHREMIEDLLRFLDEPWTGHLDPSSLGQFADVFVGGLLDKRASDTVWHANWRRREGFVYFPLEFQSSPEYFMAARVMVYEGLLYQRLIENGLVRAGKKRKLWRVVPIVLYSGKARWNGTDDLADLLDEAPELERFQRRLPYVVLDVHRFEVAELEQRPNLVAVLFQLEQSRGPDDIVRGIGRLLEFIPPGHSLRRAFTTWLRLVLLPSRAPGMDIPGLEDLEEIKTMLAESVMEWTEQWKQEGEATLLLRQAKRKFGRLPKNTRARIEKADEDQLLEWGERILTAETLDEVFKP